MPELPEVETIARTLNPQVADRVIMGVHLLRPGSLHELSLPLASLTGCRIVSTGRRGKLLLLRLADADAAPATRKGSAPGPASPALRPTVLAVHLRMTGSLMAHAPDALAGPHTRCIFDLASQAAHAPAGRLFFDDVRAFGLVLAGTPEILARWNFWRSLGPEPLGLTPPAFAACLAGKKAALKAVLLDQKNLAGVGNIYADESLFEARLDPRRAAASLTLAQISVLLAALQSVLRTSIEQCGSSIRNYRDANGDAGAFQNSFAVYGRGGQACKACGRVLQKMRVAGRGTVYCPHCQH